MPGGPGVVIELSIDPVNRPAGDELHVGAFLVEERRPLERALPRADHDHPVTPKAGKVSMAAGMRGEAGGQIPGEGRDVGEALDPNRHGDAFRLDRPTIGQIQHTRRPSRACSRACGRFRMRSRPSC